MILLSPQILHLSFRIPISRLQFAFFSPLESVSHYRLLRSLYSLHRFKPLLPCACVMHSEEIRDALLQGSLTILCCSFALYATFPSKACIWTTIRSAMRACCCFSPWWNQTIPSSLSPCATTASRTEVFSSFVTTFVMALSPSHIKLQNRPCSKWM